MQQAADQMKTQEQLVATDIKLTFSLLFLSVDKECFWEATPSCESLLEIFFLYYSTGC